MRSLAAHTVLLALALLAAFATWTADDEPETDRALVEIWDHDPARLVSATFRSEGKTLEVERRDRDGGSYLWAVETTRPPQPPSPDSAARDSTVAGAATPVPQVSEYPIGQEGASLLERFTRLGALRDLGRPDSAERAAYGLDNVRDTVTLRFRGGEQRVLAVGGSVVGGGARYVLDTTAGHVYVLPAELFQPLELPGAIGLTRLHDFSPENVRSVVLQAGGTERVMERKTTAEPPYAVWTPRGSDQPDQAFANFMGQLDGLFVTRYRPDVSTDSLQLIARADYLDARANTIGTLELFRTRASGSATYFLRTRSTIVAGEAYPPTAERIEQDVQTLFGPNTGGRRAPERAARD